MSKFIIQMVDASTGEVLDTEDETFDNEQDAQRYAQECVGAFAEGAEVLELAGENYIPEESVDFIVKEAEDED